jgi:ribosomal protein S18 acetylase RimI-like enzyme
VRLIDPTSNTDEYLFLEYLAAEPYLSFVYADETEAKAISRFLFEKSVGEAAPPHGHLAVDNQGVAVGMISYLDGTQLRQSRHAAAVTLVRSRRLDPEGAVRERMLLASDTLLSVGDDDYYLSRIATAPSIRGRGTATWLMEQLEHAATRARKHRIVLEVADMHEPAMRLYERCGYIVEATLEADDQTTKRHLTYRHMSKTLCG